MKDKQMSDTTDPKAPAGYDPSKYPPFAVTVDLTVFTIRTGQLCALLIQRQDDPYAGSWALPGGFVSTAESLDAAASRELKEETDLDVFSGHLEQLGTWGEPGRDPRMRVVSVAYLAFAPDLAVPSAGSDAVDARWWPVDDLLGEHGPGLAFDHRQILVTGLERVRSKLEYTTLATQFVAEPFTLADLHEVYTAVWGEPVGLANFRRKVMSTQGFVVPVDERREFGPAGGRPAALFTRGSATEIIPALMRGAR
jgi:8-oxo-dGTP diphosphatase